MTMQTTGRVPGLRAGGPSGHGPGGAHGHGGQHDAPLRGARQGPLRQPQGPPGSCPQRLSEELEVVTPGIGTPVRRLSGGNVQKVLVGREIAPAPTVLMTAYAVRGLDINSSYTIYDLLNEQKMKGVAVVLSARIWTCCWSCATGSWCSAAAGLRHRGRPEYHKGRGRPAHDPARKGGGRECIEEAKEPLIRMAKRDGLPGARPVGHPACGHPAGPGGLRPADPALGHINPIQVYGTIVKGALGDKTCASVTRAELHPPALDRPGLAPCVQDAVLEHRRRGTDPRRRHGATGRLHDPSPRLPPCCSSCDAARRHRRRACGASCPPSSRPAGTPTRRCSP